MLVCKFSDVSERDMDLLFLEEFVCSQVFADIFLDKVGIKGAKVIEVEQSKVDVEDGESDITVIVEKGNKKYGLLIEDKIDAIAQPNQANRYVKRGEKGKQSGEYDDYYVFIVAPQEYLEVNTEANKYPNKVAYEDILLYFKNLTDNRAIFKKQQIEQAINKQKHGYQVIENTAVTSFWKNYGAYQKEKFSRLQLMDTGAPKGSQSIWVSFRTSYKKVKIIHKSEKGCVDMEFEGLGNKTAQLKELAVSVVGKLWDQGISVEKTGKSAVLRIRVPEMNFKTDFNEEKGKMGEVLNAVNRMYEILDDIPETSINNLYD